MMKMMTIGLLSLLSAMSVPNLERPYCIHHS
jgi:hypothetical protein